MTIYNDEPCLEAGSDNPTANLVEMLEAQEWAEYRAEIIFEDLAPGASRADFIAALCAAFPSLAKRGAERIVDGVIRRRAEKPILPQYGPHPTDIFAIVAQTEPTPEQNSQRRMALSMYLEKRAARPKHDVIPAAQAKPSLPLDEDERAELELARLRVEREKSFAPFRKPEHLLRTVDYDPTAIHTAPTWLVKALFPSRGLGMLLGESQAGKSFLATHLAVCVAR